MLNYHIHREKKTLFLLILIAAISAVSLLSANYLDAADTERLAGVLDPDLRSVVSQYQKEVYDLPGEEITFPARDSQLQKYLEIARRESLDLLIARQTLLFDNEQAQAALGNLFPQLVLNETYDHETFSYQENTSIFITEFQVSQTIWDGHLWSNYKQKQAAAQASRASQASAEQTLEYQITYAYFNLIRLDETVEENMGNVQRLGKQFDIIEKMFSSGAATKADLLLARIALSAAKNNLLQSILEARSQVVQFNQSLHRPPYSQIRIHELGKVKLFVPDLDSCLALAIANRPDIKEQEAQINVAELAVTKAKRNFWPTAALVGTYGSTGADEISFSDPESSVQIEVSLPLFSAPNWPLLDSARILEENEKARLKNLKDQIAAEVTSTLLTISITVSQIRLLRDNAAMLEEHLKVQRELYQYGNVSTTDLIASFSKFAGGRKELIDAVCSYQIYMSQLRQASGGVDLPLPASEKKIETVDFKPLFCGDLDAGPIF